MLQRFFAFATILTLLSASAMAQQRISMDGAWWQSLTRDEKISVVQGMLTAFESGHVNGIADTCYKLNPKTYKACMAKMGPAKRLDLTFGGYADRIDAVYREHPALLHQHVSLFVACTLTYNEGCGEAAASIDGGSQ
jgi:hypothetical protein